MGEDRNMINCVSIGCSLAFAPYILDSAADFLAGGTSSKSIRQGGSGLIIRSDDSLRLRYQNRESSLSPDDILHYQATIEFRKEVFDILRMSDEVVLANIGGQLMLSHPQSELWFSPHGVSTLIRAFKNPTESESIDRITYSASVGRLMLSDQQSGRWVLLGSDHEAELEKRVSEVEKMAAAQKPISPAHPSIQIKIVKVQLQSAFKLANELRKYSETGEFEPFVEFLPGSVLAVSLAADGFEIRDGENRVALTRRESTKWADIVDAELKALNASEFQRGGIRTVIARNESGYWVLQWGDEVFLPAGTPSLKVDDRQFEHAGLSFTSRNGFRLALNTTSGTCIALTPNEVDAVDSAITR